MHKTNRRSKSLIHTPCGIFPIARLVSWNLSDTRRGNEDFSNFFDSRLPRRGIRYFCLRLSNCTRSSRIEKLTSNVFHGNIHDKQSKFSASSVISAWVAPP